STRFMRHRDTFFGENLKSLLHQAVGRSFSVQIPTSEEEANNPKRADKAIEDVFRQVREYLRNKDPQGLWHSHNIEYGFSRNLLGSRFLWVAIASLGAAFAIVFGIKTGAGPINPASVMNSVSLICAVYIGWAILPSATRRIADGYAETAWM